jgi:hypothetical protein
MATIVTATVAVEFIAALVLIVQPAIFAKLIFGMQSDDAVRMMGRCYGVALLALVIAWWPDRTAPANQGFFFRGRLVYNALIALYLVYLATVVQTSGALLWPAVILHASITLLIVVTWRRQG